MYQPIFKMTNLLNLETSCKFSVVILDFQICMLLVFTNQIQRIISEMIFITFEIILVKGQ